jgi:fucose permease
MYPLALTIALRRCESLGGFVLAGCGSALLPLFTGAVSARVQSLAAGLGVPLAAACVMVLLGLRVPDDRTPASLGKS